MCDKFVSFFILPYFVNKTPLYVEEVRAAATPLLSATNVSSANLEFNHTGNKFLAGKEMSCLPVYLSSITVRLSSTVMKHFNFLSFSGLF